MNLVILAIWVTLRWSSAGGDSLRLLQVQAPGDTVNRVLYANRSGVHHGPPALAGERDSGYVSVSIAFHTDGAYRFLLQSHNSAGWSAPSNPVSCFYAARDTSWAILVDGRVSDWQRTVGLQTRQQELGDRRWVAWAHQEWVQQRERARICELYGMWARRGAEEPCP